MLRTVLCCAALAVVALPCRADEPTATPETLIRLTVSPAPVPKPALRYRLLPEIAEMNPGNPVQNYLKCFMEQQKFFFDKEVVERREKLLAMPLGELPAKALQDYGGYALRQADWAARLDAPDWQILLKVKTEGVTLLLPDLQDIRKLAPALKVRFRAEVALGRFDDALRTAQTMFALSHHLSEHPTLIGDLVGRIVADTAIGPLEEMLEQPGCPNLYWALTILPNPLIPMDKGMQGERASLTSEFRDLDDASPMSVHQIQKVIAHADVLVSDAKPSRPGESRVRAWLDARIKDEGIVRAARQRLVEVGLSEERLRRFPADQILLLDEKREYNVRFDDLMKTTTLPVWQAEALAAQSKTAREPALFADILVQGVHGVRLKLARLDQRMALLRYVEALRLYAAEHDGTLPAKLSEINVPLPDDPFTGKSFRFEVAGNTAHLRGSAPTGMGKDPSYNVHYEVTLRK